MEPSEFETIRDTVRAPRAAAFAGILFAVLLGVVLVLIRRVVPADPDDAGTWLTTSGHGQVVFAVGLLPFAGIAFLWFIAVVRDHIGAGEDRFFSTIFLGSGLLFVAMLFAAGAVSTSVMAVSKTGRPTPGLWEFGRQLSYALMNTYGLRMAAVFTVASTTLAGRLRLLPRWLVIEGYLTALALLFTVTFVPYIELLFPLWVILVSVHILAAARWRQAAEAAGPGG